MTWQEVAAEKKARIAASIPPEWRITSMPSDNNVMGYPKASGILSDEELHITESSATDLVAKLAAGDLTSVAVTTAFLKRAALAHQLVNCVHEFFPEIALARARELDAYYEKTGKTVGPLHGLPISLKDQCHIKVSHYTHNLEIKADISGRGNNNGICLLDWKVPNRRVRYSHTSFQSWRRILRQD
jgi:amidase